MRCATRGVTLGTAASSATDDSRTRRAEPRLLRRLVRIVGPTPGIVSSTDCNVRLDRSFLWYVIAKRCASSRTFWSVWSAGDVGSSTSGWRLSPTSPALHTLQKVRDEAHRFADLLDPVERRRRRRAHRW